VAQAERQIDGDAPIHRRTGTVERVADPALAQRSSSFGSVADAYDRYRPSPPPSAVQWVVGSPVGMAVDIGAGTGALTRELVNVADTVLAIEPDLRMLEVLRRRSPGVPAIRGWAERLPLRSGWLDVATVSSAWHWMDPDQTVAELGRVLHPGGVLGVVWNGADRSVDWVSELLGARDPSPADQARRSRHRFRLPAKAPFTDLDSCVISWSKPMTREELVGLASTYSSTITMSPDQRERELSRVGAVADALSTSGGVDVPMSCRCWRAVRR
jgi:SAM-dependent methyltransferase